MKLLSITRFTYQSPFDEFIVELIAQDHLLININYGSNLVDINLMLYKFDLDYFIIV